MTTDLEKLLAGAKLMKLLPRERALEEFAEMVPLAERCLAMENLTTGDRETMEEILRLSRLNVALATEKFPPYVPETFLSSKEAPE